MKAIEVIHRLRTFREDTKNYPTRKEIDEAIAELEAIQESRREWYQKGYKQCEADMQNRSCDGCKHYDNNTTDGLPCDLCSRNYIDEWEKKDDN